MSEPRNKLNVPAAEALTLTALTDYGPGAIVSRTVVDCPAGTITAFAFDAGQGLSEHSAPFDAIVQVLEGAVTLRIGGKDVPTKAGQLVIMPAGVPHAVLAGERFKMLLTMIRNL